MNRYHSLETDVSETDVLTSEVVGLSRMLSCPDPHGQQKCIILDSPVLLFIAMSYLTVFQCFHY